MDLTVMSLNLRGPDDPPPHDWAHRRPRLAALLARNRPDVVGTQEALRPMLDDICADAPDDRPLAWVGVDRHGGGDDEHCAILYRRDRWRVVDHGDLALSDRPGTLGTTATATQGFPRMVTWARMVRVDGGDGVLVVNTHLDHVCAESRVLAARQLVGLVGEPSGAWPVVLTGDFNAEPGSEPYRVLTERLRPAFPDGAGADTFHGHGTGSGCIDWVLTRGLDVVGAEVLDEGPPVSDHHPVLVTLGVPTAA